jgi:indolepyruvate ferredoxin oxidoreductase, beta subunit
MTTTLPSCNVLLAGVGGQGTLVAGRILGEVALSLGLDAKVSEVHGMSQRGGSVVTYLRMAPVVHSPLIDEGEADFLLAFEQLEALRWAPFLTEGGTVVVNALSIRPLTVSIGAASYPEGIPEILRTASAGRATVVSLDASALAVASGSSKSLNVVMIGVFAARSGLPRESFVAAIDRVFPEKLRAMNQAAFAAGYEKGRGA